MQDVVGRLDATLRAARSLLQLSMLDLIEGVATNSSELPRIRALYRSATAHAADTAVSIVSDIVRIYGAGSVFDSVPLERSLRDVTTAAQHVAMSPIMYALAGRVLLGMEPEPARF